MSDKVLSKWGSLEPDVQMTYFGFPPLREYLIRSAFGPAHAKIHKDNPAWTEDLVVSTELEVERLKTF